MLNRHFLKYPQKHIFQTVLTSKTHGETKKPVTKNTRTFGLTTGPRHASPIARLGPLRGDSVDLELQCGPSRRIWMGPKVTELKVKLRWMKCSCQFLNKELNISKIIIYLIEHFILFKFHEINYLKLVGILGDLYT